MLLGGDCVRFQVLVQLYVAAGDFRIAPIWTAERPRMSVVSVLDMIEGRKSLGLTWGRAVHAYAHFFSRKPYDTATFGVN